MVGSVKGETDPKKQGAGSRSDESDLRHHQVSKGTFGTWIEVHWYKKSFWQVN